MRYTILGFGALGFCLYFSANTFAADIPTAQVRTANNLAPTTWELMLSPQYILDSDIVERGKTLERGGSYLAAELRYQPSEELGLGFGFGSGEIGYNFGAYGAWHVLPDLANQPAIAIQTGFHYNRIYDENFFVLRVVPTISETIVMEWGQITPYASVSFAPSFKLGPAKNEISSRASAGCEFTVGQMRGLSFWTEVGVNVTNSVNQLALGISYPFAELGG